MEKATEKRALESRKRRQKIIFKTWLILNNKTQKELATELGINSSAISNMLCRGRFYGVFSEWWKKNIYDRDLDWSAIKEA